MCFFFHSTKKKIDACNMIFIISDELEEEKFPSVCSSRHTMCTNEKNPTQEKLDWEKSEYEFLCYFHVTTFPWISNEINKMWDLCTNRLWAVEGERWFHVSCINSKTYRFMWIIGEKPQHMFIEQIESTE